MEVVALLDIDLGGLARDMMMVDVLIFDDKLM